MDAADVLQQHARGIDGALQGSSRANAGRGSEQVGRQQTAQATQPNCTPPRQHQQADRAAGPLAMFTPPDDQMASRPFASVAPGHLGRGPFESRHAARPVAAVLRQPTQMQPAAPVRPAAAAPMRAPAAHPTQPAHPMLTAVREPSAFAASQGVVPNAAQWMQIGLQAQQVLATFGLQLPVRSLELCHRAILYTTRLGLDCPV